jgi:sialidase-1
MPSFGNEIFSAIVGPWTPAHPRNDHQLVFPLSEDRLMFAWCEYYLDRPSRTFDTPYTALGEADDAPCKISARISRDGGRTWGAKCTLQENVGASNVKHPNLVRLNSGDILFSYTHRNRENQDLRIFVKRSVDECETWSEPRQISPPTGVHYTNADHILLHSSGRIILPSHSVTFPNRKLHCVAHCFYSDDHGENWRQSGNQIDLPEAGAEEPAVIERKNGSLLAILRTSLGKLYKATSEDRGETWSDAVSTGLDSPNTATCMKRIPSTGDLLLIWNNTLPYAMTLDESQLSGFPRNPLTRPRNPLSCAISRDEGETWENIRNIENRQDYDNAYPSVTFTKNDALIGYYANVRAGTVGIVSEVRLKIFPVEWFYK